LRLAAEQQSIEFSQGIAVGPFRVFTEKLQEQWVAKPGHDIDIAYPRFESALRPDVAKELSAYFAGLAYKMLIQSRQKPWEQSPDLFSSTHPATAMNGRWESFGVVHATNRLLSLTYKVGWYGAGAAHPNSHFETYNFSYADRLYRLKLGDFFIDARRALRRISDLCIHELEKEYWRRIGSKPDEEQVAWFKRGAGPQSENFGAFTISADRFTFLFPPYQVSSHALGKWSADVSFYDLLNVLKSDGPHHYAATQA
jgi:hypothetical protein